MSLAVVWTAIKTWGPDYRRVENFTLGSDAIYEYSDPDDYWSNVRHTLLATMLEFPGYAKPSRILITGDMTDGYFMEFLAKTMVKHIGWVPPIISKDAVVAAAKGAAEIMRRGPALWSNGLAAW